MLEVLTLEVVSIDELVEEESEWREHEPVYKMHYRVTLEDGRELGIFRNMKTGSWYQVGWGWMRTSTYLSHLHKFADILSTFF